MLKRRENEGWVQSREVGRGRTATVESLGEREREAMKRERERVGGGEGDNCEFMFVYLDLNIAGVLCLFVYLLA